MGSKDLVLLFHKFTFLYSFYNNCSHDKIIYQRKCWKSKQFIHQGNSLCEKTLLDKTFCCAPNKYLLFSPINNSDRRKNLSCMKSFFNLSIMLFRILNEASAKRVNLTIFFWKRKIFYFLFSSCIASSRNATSSRQVSFADIFLPGNFTTWCHFTEYYIITGDYRCFMTYKTPYELVQY